MTTLTPPESTPTSSQNTLEQRTARAKQIQERMQSLLKLIKTSSDASTEILQHTLFNDLTRENSVTTLHKPSPLDTLEPSQPFSKAKSDDLYQVLENRFIHQNSNHNNNEHRDPPSGPATAPQRNHSRNTSDGVTTKLNTMDPNDTIPPPPNDTVTPHSPQPSPPPPPPTPTRRRKSHFRLDSTSPTTHHSPPQKPLATTTLYISEDEESVVCYDEPAHLMIGRPVSILSRSTGRSSGSRRVFSQRRRRRRRRRTEVSVHVDLGAGGGGEGRGGRSRAAVEEWEDVNSPVGVVGEWKGWFGKPRTGEVWEKRGKGVGVYVGRSSGGGAVEEKEKEEGGKGVSLLRQVGKSLKNLIVGSALGTGTLGGLRRRGSMFFDDIPPPPPTQPDPPSVPPIQTQTPSLTNATSRSASVASPTTIPSVPSMVWTFSNRSEAAPAIRQEPTPPPPHPSVPEIEYIGQARRTGLALGGERSMTVKSLGITHHSSIDLRQRSESNEGVGAWWKHAQVGTASASSGSVGVLGSRNLRAVGGGVGVF
ncbi:hypothetical protein BCR33DRAFT_855827 [Rhizoclosmatium globosum]|uniref:Uncharacterized protein n=1 Tax=Rhizoclosmatium globosum TaxID=329046 RepID=A0A1Y2BI65_9FUNG|nr:hypothetical protein BCR33DRAFT_855827 [Rhizoclosmatium globosum]|eukprot:ORY34456.1 hypothetical protein BCR33DRAFT_855827 [Rhizoclosmatium globosum]